jgi:hypothetical protein
MKKQTAVDYLIDAIRNNIEKGTLNAIAISELKMGAKVIEKEQMLNAFITAHEYEYGDDARGYFTKDFMEYYNETYK